MKRILAVVLLGTVVAIGGYAVEHDPSTVTTTTTTTTTQPAETGRGPGGAYGYCADGTYSMLPGPQTCVGHGGTVEYYDHRRWAVNP